MEQLTDDVANGFGLAAMYLQNALLTALVAKGFLTMKDGAVVYECALQECEQKRPAELARDIHESARQILTTLARGWGTQAKGN
jgi:hypothetical protein